MALYFDEACDLSYIARDISKCSSIAEQEGVDLNRIKQNMYDRLYEWEANLPQTFTVAERPAPHVLLLRSVLLNSLVNTITNIGHYLQ